MPEPTHPTSVRIPVKLKIRLKAAAERRHQPLSLMIITALEEWLDVQKWRKR